MNTTTVSSTSIPDPVAAPAKSASSRCPYLYPNGKRCSLLGSPAHSGFCPRHSQPNFAAAIPVQVHNDAEDLSADLLPELSEFTSGTDIRQFLARLLFLITKGRISPRRASVLAFVSSSSCIPTAASSRKPSSPTPSHGETSLICRAPTAANLAPKIPLTRISAHDDPHFSGNFLSPGLVPISKCRDLAGQEASDHV